MPGIPLVSYSNLKDVFNFWQSKFVPSVVLEVLKRGGIMVNKIVEIVLKFYEYLGNNDY